ncbi:ABC transporter permease [Maribacter sp. 2-571]|uniref:ABC transporter permease n=1 Tax=Maribacter sp. 2-571 TaxID=3417569 RepID=UPI003D3398A4
MHKLLAATYKELLLLTRDLGGLAVLFLMPLLLVVTVTLIQDSTFKTLEPVKIPLLVVDNDQGTVSQNIQHNLNSAAMFEVVPSPNEKAAQKLVQQGTFQLAIVIPENLSESLAQRVNGNVDRILSRFADGESADSLQKNVLPPKEIRLYFDPATQQAFKTSVRTNIDQMVAKLESEAVYRAFQEQLTENPSDALFDTDHFITFTEASPDGEQQMAVPNATQHNIPAWTLFAIFFIILPLGTNMVNEKNQGTFVRLRTQPVPYSIVLAGKALVFIAVAMVQFALMLLVGMYLFPLLNLSPLEIKGKLPLLFLVAFFAGLAAVGLGILVGTIARTQEQSAPFAATFVVILAAIGGVWVPVFAMPGFMQTLSKVSPMNWGLNAFYDVFLRNVGIAQLLPEIGALSLFFIITTLIALLYNAKKNAI